MVVLTSFLLTLLCVVAEPNKSTQSVNISAQKQTVTEKTTFINTTKVSNTTAITTTEVISTEITTVEPLNTTVGTCESDDTECMSVNVTTASPSKNDTETNKPAKEKNKEQLRPKIESDITICTCNLQVNFCDINCCCDPDCSTSDKTVFGYCEIDENTFYDTRYCNYIKYIYVNNTPLKWEVNQDGLFCVISSNVPDTYLIQKEDPINSIEAIPLEKKFWHQEQDNIWDKESQLGYTNYGFGDPIMTIRDNSLIDNFRLPKNFLTSPCIFEEDIYYLNDVKNSCSQISIADDNEKLNFSSYFKKFKIVGSPKLFNVTKLKKNIFRDCPRNICIEIEPKLCDIHFTNCTDVKTDNTSSFSFYCSYDLKKNLNTCQHAVQKIHYKFFHNGTNGIQKVEVLGALKNFSYHFGRKDFEILQDFSVEFLWINQIKNYSQIRSGNPGYLTGKPILVGTKMINGNATLIKRNSTNFLDNFLVFPANVDSLCVRNDTYNTPIEFEYNMIAKCELHAKLTISENKLNATNICGSIQENIFNLWGLEENNYNHNKSLAIGLFGNANGSNTQDWTSILYKTDPKKFLNNIQGNFTNRNTTLVCQNISTLLIIDVYYSRADLKTILNQNKILGVSFTFKDLRRYSFSLDKKNNSSLLDLSLGLVGQVSFYDVTGEKARKYVDPPSFDIRLPYDFFYPFIRVGNGASSVMSNILLVTLFLCWNFLCY